MASELSEQRSEDSRLERRRIVVIDGGARYELVLHADTPIGDALAGIGITLEPGRQVLLERGGREVAVSMHADELVDGAVLAVVDLEEAPPASMQEASGASRSDRGATTAWWMIGAAALLLSMLTLLLPEAIDTRLGTVLAVAMGAGAVASAAVRAARIRDDDPRHAAVVLAPLALAFAAGVVAVPVLPAGSGELRIFAGFSAAAVLAGMLLLITRSGRLRAELGTATTILIGLALLWAIALALSLPTAAPAAVALGAVPVVLRALPATLIDVPPGMFINYRQLQSTRWTVRQHVPEEVDSIGSAAARDLVGRSSARLLVGTAMLSAVAAVCAPFAIPSFDGADPLVLGGQIGLACATTLALLLGARRASVALLQWMPRAAAAVIIAVVVLDAVRASGGLWLVVLAGVLLAAGVGMAFVVVPVARGARSLAWSRFGDRIEGLAVVLALPAGLLAADAIDLLRGMMGA